MNLKKMKKSRLNKRLEADSMDSQNLRRQVKPPGKPPPLLAMPTGAATLQKKSAAGAAASTPDYMKSTTSTDARREQSKVSTKSPQTRTDNSGLHRGYSNSSKLSLSSSEKATKTLARTTSLKMMGTLTKTPSVITARALVKKGSPSVLCENLYVKKATCSSTLKGCKFPDYLKVSPGGTELEGASSVKVCLYNYCSLNSRHHSPLPPLKCFLSARRWADKTRRSVKQGCLSPRPRPTGGRPNFGEELPDQYELTASTISLTQERHKDFFIEIYNMGKRDCAELVASAEGRDETATENHEEEDLEMLSDGQMCCDIDSHGTLEQIGDLNSRELETAAHSHKMNQDVEIADEVSPPSLAQEAKLDLYFDIAVKSIPTVEFHELDSESSDIDRERGQNSPTYLDGDYEFTPKMEKDPGNQECKTISDAESIVNLDNRPGWSFNEIRVGEVSEESFRDESLSSDTQSTRDDCESVGSHEYLESLCNIKTSVSVVVPVPEAVSQVKFEGNQTPRIDPQSGDKTICCNVMVEEETSLDNLKDESLPNEDSTAVMGNQASDLLKGPIEEMRTTIGNAMCYAITKDQVSNQTSSDEVNRLSDAYQTNNIENQVHMEKECNQAENFKIVSPMDPTNKPYAAVSGLDSSETEYNVVHEAKYRDTAIPETEDSSPTPAAVKCKMSIQDSDELGHFNPRSPDFLPLEPDSETEKVDLRHCELDERKNAEEWMVDYALRQAVTKLGPARKRKVALLVEAFEKVAPSTRC